MLILNTFLSPKVEAMSGFDVGYFRSHLKKICHKKKC